MKFGSDFWRNIYLSRGNWQFIPFWSPLAMKFGWQICGQLFAHAPKSVCVVPIPKASGVDVLMRTTK